LCMSVENNFFTNYATLFPSFSILFPSVSLHFHSFSTLFPSFLLILSQQFLIFETLNTHEHSINLQPAFSLQKFKHTCNTCHISSS
jgi:hypothetical protein